MAAAAYRVTLVMALGSPTGQRKSVGMTASDVAAASWLFPSGSSAEALHGGTDVFLVDAILSASGTDTTQSEFFVGGSSTGFFLQNANSLGTVIGRPLQNAPIRVPKGLQLQVIQRA